MERRLLSYLRMRVFVGIAIALSCFACGGDGNPDGSSDAPTYYRDVEPIVQVSCNGCHAPGGIGPVQLTPETAPDLAGLMSHQVQSGLMPPWQPSDLGPALHGDRRLAQDEIDTIVAWAAAGAPLGDPADHQDRAPVRSFNLTDPDHAFRIAEPYYPDKALEDDVRCFIIELPFTTNTWLRAVRFHMDQRVMVHHIGAGIASGAEAQKARQIDAADPGPGYGCSGGFRVNLSSGLGIGGPGAEGYEYPGGAGAFIPANSIVIMTIHYYTPFAGSAADRSGVDLWVSPTPLRPMGQLSISGPSELPCPGGPSSASGDRCNRDTSLALPGAFTPIVNRAINNNLLRHCGYTLDQLDDGLDFSNPTAARFLVKRQCEGEVPYDGTLRLVANHMHTRGADSRIEVQRGGQWEVLFDIPRWDWHWESSYLLADTVGLRRGDKLRVTCTFDNGVAAQPADPARAGALEAVRYVTAAEGRTDEMCGGSLWIERTPIGQPTLCAEAKQTFDRLCPGLGSVSSALWGGACTSTAEMYAVQLLGTPDASIPYYWCDVEPTGTAGATCSQTLSCATQCTTQACVDTCEAQASPRGGHRYDRVMSCAAQWCAGDTGQLWSACVGVACGHELGRCLQ
jgi:mono/diheme cytochrome c family protein